MRITISQKEFEAICYAEEQLNTAIEASDDDFAHDASIHNYHLLRIIAKLRDAMLKDRERAEMILMAKQMYPNEKPEVIKRIVTKALKTQNTTRSG